MTMLRLRPRLRFSLRALFVPMSVAGAGAGWSLREMRINAEREASRHSALEFVMNNGGAIVWFNPSGLPVKITHLWLPESLRSEIPRLQQLFPESEVEVRVP